MEWVKHDYRWTQGQCGMQSDLGSYPGPGRDQLPDADNLVKLLELFVSSTI